MIKKSGIVVVILLVFSFIGIFVFETYFGKTISNSLSDRSREYIKEDNISNSESVFSQALEKNKNDTKGKRMYIGECFSFIMPFKVSNERQDKECEGYFGIENPRGTIVAYIREGRVGTFDQMEGVSFRRQDKNYKETKENINGREYLLFKNTQSGYQKSAFYLDSEYYFIITLTAQTDKNLDQEFKKILSSINFDK